MKTKEKVIDGIKKESKYSIDSYFEKKCLEFNDDKDVVMEAVKKMVKY